MTLHDIGRVVAKLAQVILRERRRGADDVAIETDIGRLLDRQQMRAHDVLNIGAAIEQFVHLQVGVLMRIPSLGKVVVFGEEARGAQHDARQAVQAMHQLAQVLGRDLGDAVDVLRDRRDRLGDPRGGRVDRRSQRMAEGAGRAREYERAHVGGHGFFEQVQGTADVDIDEGLTQMRRDMRLVQRGGMQDRIDAMHRVRNECPIDDRPDEIRIRRGKDIDADRTMRRRAQGAHQRFAEMTGASGDEDVQDGNQFSEAKTR